MRDLIIVQPAYCGWFSKEDVDNSDILLIGIVVRVLNKALNDLLAFCPCDWVVAAHGTLNSSNIVWKAGTQKMELPLISSIRTNYNPSS